MDQKAFLSVRCVSEYAYCPRLFYFMGVEGVFLPSADTEEGVAVHRRVDRPSAVPGGGEEECFSPCTHVVRGLKLASESLELSGVLDVVEMSGTVAVPVEYRKGRPRRPHAVLPENSGNGGKPRPEPWPADRVQVGLQAVLLKEAGYEVPKAVIYYAAEKLRLEIEMNEDLEAEALAVLEAARRCAAGGKRPLPLENDPRCVRCSLQPICLPDEVNQQRREGSIAKQALPRIWPPRDDGIHVVVQQRGVKVGVRGGAMVVTDAEGHRLKETPLVNVESVSLLGSVQISTQAVRVLADRGIPVAYLSASGRLVAMIDPLDSVSAHVRRAQVMRLEDERARVELARALIAAKIRNQRTLLMRNHPALPTRVARDLAEAAERAAGGTSLSSIRGYEGRAAALYFRNFAGMLKTPLAARFEANGRRRRPPRDPVNACISFAYALLVHECTVALRLARLEPSIGAYHVSRPGRPAFSLDLMEPFRPLVADSVALGAFNRGELTEGHFHQTASGCVLTSAGRKAFMHAYGRRMNTEITHPVFAYRLSYRRMLVLHARMIAAWLVGDVPGLAFLTTR